MEGPVPKGDQRGKVCVRADKGCKGASMGRSTSATSDLKPVLKTEAPHAIPKPPSPPPKPPPRPKPPTPPPPKAPSPAAPEADGRLIDEDRKEDTIDATRKHPRLVRRGLGVSGSSLSHTASANLPGGSRTAENVAVTGGALANPRPAPRARGCRTMRSVMRLSSTTPDQDNQP